MTIVNMGEMVCLPVQTAIQRTPIIERIQNRLGDFPDLGRFLDKLNILLLLRVISRNKSAHDFSRDFRCIFVLTEVQPITDITLASILTIKYNYFTRKAADFLLP